jgi:C-terminal processing protease CtpA/Prc
MIKKINIICITLFCALILGCSKEYEVPQNLVVHDFVWKGLNAYYLHQDQVADLSDRRFSSDQELNAFLNSFPDYNLLFESLTIENDLKSNLVEDYNTLTSPELRSSFTNGLEFGIIADPNNTDNVLGYVTHILPNSNAALQNIARGDYFNAVDGVLLTRQNYQDLLLNGQNIFTLNMANFDGNTITPATRTVSLEKEGYNYPATFLEDVISINSDNVGYIMYNNDFSNIYIDDLKQTASNFVSQNVNKLVLDLRYSIGSGSFARDIEAFASVITGQFQDEVFLKENWNTKAQAWFLENQPDSLLTRFSASNQTTTVEGMQVTDLFIILNGNNFEGSSAIELLVNSLNPYMNIQIIGNNTAGNNTGSITLYNSDDYDFGLRNTTHTVALQPVVLTFTNNNDQTYNNGLTPIINLCNQEDVLNLGVLGTNSDPILNSVLNLIETGAASSNSNCNPNNYEYLFNSINVQRNVDNGVFIEQDLPNTN